jgi:hypothetical protein
LPAPTAALSGSEPDGVSQALAMRQCENPMAAITNLPDGGVIFNNAMTSVDAGFIDRAQPVLDAVAARSLELRCCFERWLGSHPDDQPRAMLEVTLAADGGVQGARIDPQRSTITDPPTLACITGLARDIAFPPSPSGKTTIVEYPIAVSAGGPN